MEVVRIADVRRIMSSRPPAFAPDAQLAGVRVLLADDDDDLREVLSDLLAAFGIEVLAARSGTEAYEVFARERPDVLISDIQMAGGGGLDLIRRIRALPPEQGGLTPAIAMSGTAQLDEVVDAGFHFHFVKPAPAQALIDTLRSFVRDDQPHESWSIGIEEDTLVIRFEGHVTVSDMRAMTSALVAALERKEDGYRVVSDLRRLSSFSPAVAAAAQVAVWRLRARIRSVVVVGGPALARAVSRGACMVLGIPCSLTETWPS